MAADRADVAAGEPLDDAERVKAVRAGHDAELLAVLEPLQADGALVAVRRRSSAAERLLVEVGDGGGDCTEPDAGAADSQAPSRLPSDATSAPD